MTLKKYISVAAAILALVMPRLAAAQDPSGEYLPEEKVIAFDEKIHDFGDVLLSEGALKWKFNFTNISDQPIVIHNVISSCGCTTPEWTKAPVKAGGTGYVNVTFTNDQGPYPFDKTLTVYVSGVNRPVILRIRGYAHERMRKPTEIFSERIGRLGFRSREVQFGYVDQGSVKSDKITVANLGPQPITVVPVETSCGLKITIEPETIPSQGSATMRITVDAGAQDPQIWGRQNFVSKFSINGQVFPLKLVVATFIKDNFNDLTSEQEENAASIATDASYFDFGTVAQGKTVDAAYVVRNTGKSPLVIHKVEADRAGMQFTGKSPLTIAPGAEAKLKFKFDTSNLSGQNVVVITLITNSPAKPLFNLFLTGTIKK